MPTSIGRDAEIEGALTMMSSGTSSGLLITGDAGVGKTFLAETVAEALVADPSDVWTVYANEVSGEIPFGALAANLPSELAASGVAPTIALKRVLAATDASVVILIDDAPMLDVASAEALTSAAESGMARLVVTQRDGSLLPRPLRRAARSGLLARLECGPLSEASTVALARHVAGRSLTAAAEQVVIAHTRGNPLYVRELILASVDVFGDDQDREVPLDVPRLPAEARRLQDLLQDRLAGLTPEELEAVRWIASTEPVGPGELEHVAPEVLDRLESSGLITARLDDRRIVVRVAHPMHAELLNVSTSALTRRAIRAATAERIGARGAQRREDRLRLATWSLEGNPVVAVPMLVAAAHDAFAAGDVDLAVRLGEAAFEREATFEHGRLLFASLYEHGGSDALAQHFDAWRPLAVESSQIATFEMAAAKAGYWRFGRDEAPDVLLAMTPDRPEGLSRQEMVAESAAMFATAGRIGDALSLSEPMLQEPPGRVMALATLASGHGRRAAGRPVAAIDALAAAGTAYEAIGPDVYVMSENVLGSARVQALAEAGRFDEASEWFDAIMAFARDSGSPKAAGLAQLAQGWSLSLQGQFDRAHSLFEGARRDLTIAQHPGMVRWAIAAQALARAHAGDHAATGDLLDDFDSMGSHPAQIFDSLAVRARAFLAHHRGDTESALRLLTDESESSERRGDVVAAIGCLHDLARLGHASIAQTRSRHLAAEVEGDYWPVVLEHIAALAAAESMSLVDVADRAETVGCPHLAAESLTRAVHHAGPDSGRQVTNWLHRAEQIRAALGIGHANGHEASALLHLTRREREVAYLAAQGLSSKSIAARLFIGERTVDSHLARAYNKLGVHGRDELAVLIASNGRRTA